VGEPLVSGSNWTGLRVLSAYRSTVLPAWCSITPRSGGGAECAGNTISLEAAAPIVLPPSFNQNSPAMVSQPVSELRAASSCRRHCSIEET